MVDVRFYFPAPQLGFLVRQFETIRISKDQKMTDKFIPRPDAALVFHFRTCPRITSPVCMKLPPFFVAPVVPANFSLTAPGDLDTFIVVCHASVLSRVFRIHMFKGCRFHIPLDPERFQPLWEKLKAVQTDPERIEIFSVWLGDNCPKKEQDFDEIDQAYLRFLKCSVKTPMSAIVAASQMSQCTLQRKFANRVGVSPKTLMRITRLNYLWDRFKFGRAVNYQDLVFEGNYFDQAHFIKDFKSMTGETPGHFFARNHVVVRILSGRPG